MSSKLSKKKAKAFFRTVGLSDAAILRILSKGGSRLKSNEKTNLAVQYVSHSDPRPQPPTSLLTIIGCRIPLFIGTPVNNR